MTWFTEIRLNSSRRDTFKILQSTEALHAMLENTLPSTPAERESRLLWRLDDTSTGKLVYMVTDTKPDSSGIVESVGWPGYDAEQTIRSIEYDRLLDKLEAGDEFFFRCAVNPVKRRKSDQKLIPLIKRDLVDWISCRMEASGIRIDADDLRKVSEETDRFNKKGGHMVTLRRATFEGRCVIADPDKARTALINGIGRGKAYGCGLITLSR